MKKYRVKVSETFEYFIDVEANNKQEAIENIKREYYDSSSRKYDSVFVADATTIADEKTKFKVVD